MKIDSQNDACARIESILLSNIEFNPLRNLDPKILSEGGELSFPKLDLTENLSKIDIAYADLLSTIRTVHDASFLHAADQLSWQRFSEIQKILR